MSEELDVRVSCRDLDELNPLVNTMLDLALVDIKKAGIMPLVTETYRPQKRQNYLYCQGRTVEACVAKGIDRKFSEEYCNPKVGKCTWTLNSKHKNRTAVDLVPQREVDGKLKAIWNAKDPQTLTIIKIMTKYGFEAGANWQDNVDSPHFQVDGDFTTIFKKEHTTPYVTKAIQTALNKKLGINLIADGEWGAKTDKAVIDFRKKMKYSSLEPIIGSEAFKALMR